MKLIIGTRGSNLALRQAEYVKQTLEQAYLEHEFELKIIKTKGDNIQNKPLSQIGDKGLFVKEIEQQILKGEVDIGVHSMKDMPAFCAEGLMFTKCWRREDPRDVLILREKQSLSELSRGAKIGTGSKRRKFQLLKLRPDLEIVDIRGNIDTRLDKMEKQKLDGIVLAAAGLHRLKRTEIITEYLEFSEMISAPAQGILALEIRKEDTQLAKLLDAFSDERTQQEALAERGFLQEMKGGCHVPIGAVCLTCADGTKQLKCIFGTEEGDKLVYASVNGIDPILLAKKAAKEIRRQLAGTVFLVGGGPGDPDLITVKGQKAIRKADCIIYDKLSSPRLLEEAKTGCEMIYVGKANHHHTKSQEEINQLLVDKAMEYETVVRLKGGDGYVFGRGGEEGVILKEKGIPFSVIPGISSSLAGLAYAGIPITYRGLTTGFHVVTAHDKTGELADLDFKTIASSGETCVFIMGLSKLSEIVEKLKKAGMSQTAKIAVISNATTNKQKTVVSELANIVKEVEKIGLEAPALIVIGKVISFREKLNFFEEKPLFGKQFLVLKIGKAISSLTEMLEESGAYVEELQTGEIISLPDSFSREELEKANWLVFTSQNGVRAFFEHLFSLKLDVRALKDIKIAAIGGKTAACLQQYKITADLVPQEYHSDALKKALKEVVKPTDIVCYPKGINAGKEIKKDLEKVCQFVEWNVYENRVIKIKQLQEATLKQYDGIFFTCASCVERFFSSIENNKILEEWNKKDCIYSIGPKSSSILKKFGVKRIIQAPKATYEALAKIANGS